MVYSKLNYFGGFLMKDFSFLKDLVWITELGLSVASPLVVFIVGAVWLRDAFSLPAWVIAIGAVLGALGAVGGLATNLKRMAKSGKKEDEKTQFNEHI